MQAQYELRKTMDIRVKDPRETVHYKIEKKNMRFGENQEFGRPYAPSTPMKDVLRNFFGDIGV